jgi:hypothetical protein
VWAPPGTAGGVDAATSTPASGAERSGTRRSAAPTAIATSATISVARPSRRAMPADAPVPATSPSRRRQARGPRRQGERRHADVGDLQQQPGRDQVEQSHPDHVSPLQFVEEALQCSSRRGFRARSIAEGPVAATAVL